MQKIINELINFSVKNADVYRWKDATWLIFTDETRWVVELTDGGTLWYNYRFFKDAFKYISMECGQQTEGYIIEWANNFFYNNCAHRSIAYPQDKYRLETPKVVNNGIKNLSGTRTLGEHYIDMVVTSGIKETKERGKNHGDEFEWHTLAVIDKGIKDAKPNRITVNSDGISRFYYDPKCSANTTFLTDIIEEGVKEAKSNIEYSKETGVYHPDCIANHININKVIDEGVKSGIKNIYPDKIPDDYDWSDEFKADQVIDGGVKLMPLPDPSGELRGYSDYYNTKEDRTKPHTEYVKETIENGQKIKK